MNDHKVVFQKPGTTQEQVMADMRTEMRKLFKTPRNAPCPCGARSSEGKPIKFKKCCLKAVPA